MNATRLFLGLFFAATTAAAQQAAPMTPAERSTEIVELKAELARLSQRLDALEKSDSAPAATVAAAPSSEAVKSEEAKPAPLLTAADEDTLTFFRGTTFAIGFDGYYGYNFNEPIGRVNLLRAYDVSSNSFSINQVSLIAEHLPSPASRFGGRVDLQYGQATETLQGSSANEQRPQVWRNLFQAYGSYLAPVGSGLELDFGKFASALGNEGNYTKDQVTYSRAYSFNYLPFYHTGLRATYTVNPKVTATYWLVNGANDTEDLNGFKSQGFLFALAPAKSVSWNLNYYFGEEARDVQPTVNPGAPTSPTQPGLPTVNINPAPNGREHIFDTYATWTATSKLSLTGEADYVLNRTTQEQRPPRVAIGSLTARYILPRQWSAGARGEYFDDRGGLFSGSTQALKEATFIVDHRFAPGFLARAEYRRDWSNQRFFLSDTVGVLEHAQTTTTLGLVCWWGTKQGAW